MIERAINTGTAYWNEGDTVACERVYSEVAQMNADLDRRLSDALQQCATIGGGTKHAEARAWVLRHAFDSILDTGAPEQSVCEVCGQADRIDQILLCDGPGCACEYHMSCLQPPLLAVPEGEWFCPKCVENGAGAQAGTVRVA